MTIDYATKGGREYGTNIRSEHLDVMVSRSLLSNWIGTRGLVLLCPISSLNIDRMIRYDKKREQ